MSLTVLFDALLMTPNPFRENLTRRRNCLSWLLVNSEPYRPVVAAVIELAFLRVAAAMSQLDIDDSNFDACLARGIDVCTEQW